MGAYPSASLLYGIDLGMEEETGRPDWFTEELEAEYGGLADVLEHLFKDHSGVGYDTYGNFVTGFTGLALCTQAVHVTAYCAQPVGVHQLTGTVDDDRRLRAAWAVLYPDQVMPEPGWFMVVSYG